MSEKIKSFTDLIAWQRARELVLTIYKATENFPKKEIYGLTDQMRRAAVSVTSNIAEGFSRKSKADKAHFYTIAKSSLVELQNQLIIAKDINYLENNYYQATYIITINCSKLLVGLIRAAEAKQSSPHTTY
ncbi:MAG: four helix bundle protein [Patescibacteria group bacterium]